MILFAAETEKGVEIIGLLRYDEVARLLSGLPSATITIPIEIVKNAVVSGGRTLEDIASLTFVAGAPGENEDTMVGRMLALGHFKDGVTIDDRRPAHSGRN